MITGPFFIALTLVKWCIKAGLVMFIYKAKAKCDHDKEIDECK